MDWDRVIERQGNGLRQVLATLVAMAGLGAGPGEGVAPALTLPHRLYRAVLCLLRPAEAAARRLIIIAAHGLIVTLPPPRSPKSTPKRKSIYVRPGQGTGVVVPWGVRMPDARPRSRLVNLPLFDPPWRNFIQRRHCSSSTPRLSSFDSAPFGSPARPSLAARGRRDSSGRIDATRLGQRLDALRRALDNLPKQALRFARWKARRAAGLSRRISPLRLGRAYALRRTGPRRQVDDILADTHYFARAALSPDTS